MRTGVLLFLLGVPALFNPGLVVEIVAGTPDGRTFLSVVGVKRFCLMLCTETGAVGLGVLLSLIDCPTLLVLSMRF